MLCIGRAVGFESWSTRGSAPVMVCMRCTSSAAPAAAQVRTTTPLWQDRAIASAWLPSLLLPGYLMAVSSAAS
jgi:hypothetical protein